eukprot:TRINITY_DN7839_c0_g1_i1.p1 TRINITY_DN7839_c0_g1~~TRINITY_DN7839_c0_g1_i1.p1  ORF type:complete len:531 (-),score=30.07 TRINITY_DN7839_c0_g1_i1:28-1620(-)
MLDFILVLWMLGTSLLVDTTSLGEDDQHDHTHITTTRTREDCISNPFPRGCMDFVYPNTTQDLKQICKEGERPQCNLWKLCEEGQAGGPYCTPFSLLKSVCLDSPELPQCQGFSQLCRVGSTVQACTRFVLALPSKEDLQSNLLRICNEHSQEAMCRCQQCSMWSRYIEYCRRSGPSAECQDWYRMCVDVPEWGICSREMESISSPCVRFPDREECKTYVYPLAQENVNSICNAHPSVPECKFKKLCEEYESNNTYCSPFSQLKALCSSQSYPVCSYYYSMCQSNSQVESCNSPALSLPSLPTLLQQLTQLCQTSPHRCGDCRIPLEASEEHHSHIAESRLSQKCDYFELYISKCMTILETPNCFNAFMICEDMSDWPICQSGKRGEHSQMAHSNIGGLFELLSHPVSLAHQVAVCVFLLFYPLLKHCLHIVTRVKPQNVSSVVFSLLRFTIVIDKLPLGLNETLRAFVTFFEKGMDFLIMYWIMSFYIWYLFSVALGYALLPFVTSRVEVKWGEPLEGNQEEATKLSQE